jgi:hypothetical protein
MSIASRQESVRHNESYSRFPGNMIILKSSLIPSIPNGIKEVNNGSSKSQLALGRSISITKIPNVVNSGELKSSIQATCQPRPQFNSKLTIKRKMKRRFFLIVTKTTNRRKVTSPESKIIISRHLLVHETPNQQRF